MPQTKSVESGKSIGSGRSEMGMALASVFRGFRDRFLGDMWPELTEPREDVCRVVSLSFILAS